MVTKSFLVLAESTALTAIIATQALFVAMTVYVVSKTLNMDQALSTHSSQDRMHTGENVAETGLNNGTRRVSIKDNAKSEQIKNCSFDITDCQKSKVSEIKCIGLYTACDKSLIVISFIALSL